eukprot:gene11076-23152_t
MGGGVSTGNDLGIMGSGHNGSSSNFTYVTVRLEMEKLMIQSPKPTKHKTRSNILVLEGRRYIFNPSLVSASDLDGAISEDEFIATVKQINDAGIRAIVGLPCILPMQKRLQLTEDAIIVELGRLNSSYAERSIHWDLKLQHGSSSYINKSTLVSTLHVVFPRNSLCTTLASGIAEITASYEDNHASHFGDTNDSFAHTHMQVPSQPPHRGSASMFKSKNKSTAMKIKGTAPTTPSPAKGVPPGSSSSTSFSSSTATRGGGGGGGGLKHQPQQQHPIRDSNNHVGGSGGGGGGMGIDEFDFGTTPRDRSEDCEYGDTASELHQANITALSNIAPRGTPRHVLESYLRSANGDVDLAAQMLLSASSDDTHHDIDNTMTMTNGSGSGRRDTTSASDSGTKTRGGGGGGRDSILSADQMDFTLDGEAPEIDETETALVSSIIRRK